jgi:two-component system response regulator YesN
MLKEIPLNDDYIRKLFLKEVGTTPLQYLTEKRINHAKQLLETRYETSTTIKEIADKAGFNDQYYFSRAFKKVTGKSPSEWNA